MAHNVFFDSTTIVYPNFLKFQISLTIHLFLIIIKSEIFVENKHLCLIMNY